MAAETNDTAPPQPRILRTAAKAARACSLIMLALVVLSSVHLEYVLFQWTARLAKMIAELEVGEVSSTVLFPWACACVLLLVIAGMVAKECLLKNKLDALIINGAVLAVLEFVKWAAIFGMAAIGEMQRL